MNGGGVICLSMRCCIQGKGEHSRVDLHSDFDSAPTPAPARWAGMRSDFMSTTPWNPPPCRPRSSQSVRGLVWGTALPEIL